MANAAPPKDMMNYEAMTQDALRGVVKSALKRAAGPGGLPGQHHLYITFRTKAPGVSGPNDLLGKYPDEMTIVLQHQYWDLDPGDAVFSVTLKFGGEPKTLSVPYAALTRFYDPSVQFLLQFEASADGPARSTPKMVRDEPEAEEAPAEASPSGEAPAADEPKVVSLDQFRKK